MDERLQKIVKEAQVKFGLENYTLGTSEIYKERDANGKAFYNFTMEWYPLELGENLEEDLNPDGTAIIDYHIQKEQFMSVTFVQGVSYSTVTQFPNKSIEEVSAWLDEEWGLAYGSDVKLIEDRSNYFRFESEFEGVRMSPNFIIEVEFDGHGKLLSYHTYGLLPVYEQVKKGSFTLTLEEIEPLVRKQLQLVEYPSESENRLIPVYAMEEIYIKVEDTQVIPFSTDDHLEVTIDEFIEWDQPVVREFKREELQVLTSASTSDAFGDVDIDVPLILTNEQIMQSKRAVREVFQSEYPNESGFWKIKTLRRQENFIEAHCTRSGDEVAFFKRKLVVFLHPKKMTVLNFIDNQAFLKIGDSFAPAEKAAVTHNEAFEKLLSYIYLEPTYVYDAAVGKYVLCGLLDAAEAVHAVTGDLISLSEI